MLCALSSDFLRSVRYDDEVHECAASFTCEQCFFSALAPTLDIRLPDGEQLASVSVTRPSCCYLPLPDISC